jgi:hypothetical protein
VATGYRPADEHPTYKQHALVTDKLVVVNHTFSQDPADPYLWRVVVHYAGTTDATAQPAEVSSEEVEFIDYVNVDLRGRAVANSAGDLYSPGMPVDRSYKVIKITRHLPYNAWNMKMGDAFRHTLNKHPFVLSRQVETDGAVQTPVKYRPGQCRIKKLVEQEVLA